MARLPTKWCKSKQKSHFGVELVALSQKTNRKGIFPGMFYGQAKHSIDAKGRVILPSKYREDLGESFFVLRGFEKCLFVYTKEDYRELEAKIKALPISNDGGRIQRYIFNYTELVTTDKQGRFVIPPGLREFAGLNKDIIIAGASSRIEIWDVEEYEKYEKQTEDEPQKLSEILNIFGI